MVSTLFDVPMQMMQEGEGAQQHRVLGLEVNHQTLTSHYEEFSTWKQTAESLLLWDR